MGSWWREVTSGWKCRIEEMAILQKQLIAKASLAGKPVITATRC